MRVGPNLQSIMRDDKIRPTRCVGQVIIKAVLRALGATLTLPGEFDRFDRWSRRIAGFFRHTESFQQCLIFRYLWRSRWYR